MVSDVLFDGVDEVLETEVKEIFVPDTTGVRGSFTEEAARAALYEIVNNDQLTLIEKEDWLDVLYFKVGNCHERGMAADVIEDIFNEQTHLRYPEWRGRHRNWRTICQANRREEGSDEV